MNETPTIAPVASAPIVNPVPASPSKPSKPSPKAEAKPTLPTLPAFLALVQAAPSASPSAKATLDGVIAWASEIGMPCVAMRSYREHVLSRIPLLSGKCAFTTGGTRTTVTVAIVKGYSEVAKHFKTDDRRAEDAARAYDQAKRAFAVLSAITEAQEVALSL